MSDVDDPAFDEAYALLDAEFGAKGELERRDAYEAYLARATETLGHRIVVARDRDGTIAAVRDCNVTAKDGVVVVFLSHVLVLPPHRRTGLGSVMRHVPVALGRRAGGSELLMAAEMEPVKAGDPDTVVRLLAYGRAGYRAIDPASLPYLQPDYRAHDLIDRDGLRPVPLLPVVRWVGHETETSLPKRLARAYVEHLYAIVGVHCREQDLARPRAFTLGVLDRAPGDHVALLPLPTTPDDPAAAALSADRVLSYYPSELPPPGITKRVL